MKKVILLALAIITTSLFMLSGCADDGSSGGSSTVNSLCTNLTGVGYDNSSGTWEIYNANGLKAFRDEVNGGDSDLHAKLVCDIALDNTTSWERISSYGGIFDGDNHTISNLFIDNDTIEHQGLFFVILPDGVVKNLKLKDVDITANAFVGSLVAQNQGLVQNVHVDNVTINGNVIIGGVVGWNNIGDVIMSTANNVTLIANGSAGNDGTGGVVGVNDNLMIATSANNIDITANFGVDYLYVGGVAGRSLNANSVLILSYANNLTFDTPSTNIGGVTGNKASSVAISNFFISDDPMLFGIGGATPNDDNATHVDDIEILNNDIDAMNKAINDYELANSVVFGYRWQAGSPSTELPTVVEHTTPIQSITLLYPQIEIYTDETLTPTIVIAPTNTSNREVKYTSSDNGIASVDEKTGVVTGKSQGSATIRATSTANSAIYDEVEITVSDVPDDPCFDRLGDGYNIENGNWKIYTVKGLNAFRDEVNAVNSALHAKLMCDITLTNKADNTSWQPIGNVTNRYTGTFNGDNYTISGLYINDSQLDYQAFFGAVGANGSVTNLIIDNASILGRDNVSAVSSYNGGTINNVSVVNGTISGNNNVGGIAGLNEGGTVSASINSANVTSTGSNTGGIIGDSSTTIGIPTLSSLIACYNTGDISGVDNVGGIVGNNFSAEIYSSFNMGNVVGTGTNIGGVIGFNFSAGTILENYYLKDASVNSSLNGIGNIAGQNQAEIDNAAPIVSIAELNTKVVDINNAIDTWVKANREFGYRYEVGANNISIPQLYVPVLESLTLSYPAPIYVGDIKDPNLSYEPSDTVQRGVIYTIDDDSFATINATSGVLTTKSKGRVKVTVTSTDNSSIKAEFLVNILDSRCASNDLIGFTDNKTTGVWEIYNVNGLIALRDNFSQNAKLVCDIDLKGNFFNRWNDYQIGADRERTYSGTFDGGNYTISGLYIDSSRVAQGLFGYTSSSAVIKNLKVKDVYIKLHGQPCGVIVGVNEGNIYASSVSNVELVMTAQGSKYIGGIVGQDAGGAIIATYVDNLTINTEGQFDGIGGIVGVSTGHIVSSYANNVTIVNTGGSEEVGGIVSSNRGTLSSNFFISDNELLFGDGYNSNTNAERVTSIQALNDNVSVMNSGIDAWVRDNIEIGVRYEVLGAPDNATDIPTFVTYP